MELSYNSENRCYNIKRIFIIKQRKGNTMNKKALIILSAIPIPSGFLLNTLIMNNNWVGLPLLIVGAALYLLWFYLGKLSAARSITLKSALLCAHITGIICFTLIIVQTALLQNVSRGLLGLVPQMFFLPTLALSSTLMTPLFFFVQTFRLEYFVIPAFLMMLGSFTLGYRSNK